MSEEVKTDEAKSKGDAARDCTAGWAANLTLGAIVACGVAAPTAAKINFPVVASFCSGLGAIAFSCAIRERKWLFAVASALLVGYMIYGAIDSRNCMDNFSRQAEGSFGW